MQRVTVKSVQNLVAANAASGSIKYGENNSIVFSNGVVLGFENAKTQDKVYRTLRFELGYEVPEASWFGQDEIDGIHQATEAGENVFRCTIMCSNPSLNEVN
jgi:hypothetical protein